MALRTFFKFWVPDFCFPLGVRTNPLLEILLSDTNYTNNNGEVWEGGCLVCPLHHVLQKVVESESTRMYFMVRRLSSRCERTQVTAYRRRALKSAGCCETITSKILQSPALREKEGCVVLDRGNFYSVLVSGDFGVTKERPTVVVLGFRLFLDLQQRCSKSTSTLKVHLRCLQIQYTRELTAKTGPKHA